MLSWIVVQLGFCVSVVRGVGCKFRSNSDSAVYVADVDDDEDDDDDDQGPRLPRQILPNYAAQIFEIPRHYYLQIPYILQPVGVVVLDNTSKRKEFIVTCNMETYYITLGH